jgi:uncharacterized protein (TIGR02186 family)
MTAVAPTSPAPPGRAPPSLAPIGTVPIRITRACAVAVLVVAFASVPARGERLIASLSSHIVEITSSFTGVELVLFGTIENDAAAEPLRRAYDIVATVTGPRQELVTRRKERIFGIWVNARSRTFRDVPSYLAVLSTRPFDDFADAKTLQRQQVGIANAAFAQSPPGAVSAGEDEFRRAFLRIKGERGFYRESTNGLTFLTPTLYRASIYVPAEASVGSYEVDVKLFADGGMIARTSSAFEIVTVGFERFIAASAVDHGILYGLATAALAMMTGWFASIVFRRD